MNAKQNIRGIQKSSLTAWLLIVVGLIVLGAAFFFFLHRVPSTNTQQGEATTTTSGTSTSDTATTSNTAWQSYTDSVYHFSIQYPQGWKVVASENAGSPIISFYDPTSSTAQKPPFSPFDEVTHISVYPKGFPTEGVQGSRVPTRVVLTPTIANAWDFVLTDHTPWASTFSFVHPPASWDSSGFLWARVRVKNRTNVCMRGDTVVSEAECNPMEGDTIASRGSTDSALRALEEEMLQSFHFTSPTTNTTSSLSSLITVELPTSNMVVDNPLHLRGKARGTWYFEAQFPALVIDSTGTILAQVPITAQSDWMTKDFVAFSQDIVYQAPTTKTGKLILKKDNPSGLPQNDLQLEIPIRFAP